MGVTMELCSIYMYYVIMYNTYKEYIGHST